MLNCHNCGGAVSEYAPDCGHCGTSLEQEPAVMYCGDCNSEYRSTDLYCRHCGKFLPKVSTTVKSESKLAPLSGTDHWSDLKILLKVYKWHLVVISILFTGFLFIIICNNDSDDKPKEDAASRVAATATTSVPRSYPTQIPPTPVPTRVPTPMPTPTEPPEPIRMDLADVLEQYDLNKVRADSMLRYLENGNNAVATSGYVSEVERTHVVIVPTQEKYSSQSLICHYADIRTALHLSKGQSVSIIGKLRGVDGIFNKVHMFACDVEEVQLEKQPDVTAWKLRGNVVQVYCLSGSIFSPDLEGTGVILDPNQGIVLTVHHVVADENECDAIEVKAPWMSGRIAASIIKHCASIDRARLRVSKLGLTGSSQRPIYRATAPAQVDQEIFFWGYGQGELRMEKGIVVDVWSDSVVTDAYAVPGDSGSPVFNSNGHLLGTLSRSNRSDRAVFTGDEC